MQIRANTDVNVEGREAMAAGIKSVVTATLAPLSKHLTQVEVHVSDINAGKVFQRDKR